MALVVFTGGERSGKSSAAERLALRRSAEGASVFVVAFGRGADDPEFAARVAHHRAHRPPQFATVEAHDAASWRTEVPADALLVVDCLGTLLGLVMEQAWGEGTVPLLDAPPESLPEGFADACSRALDASLDWLIARQADTVVVTNEVGAALVPTYATGRLFAELLGRANRRLVDAADASYLAVAGRLIALGQLSREAEWPRD